MGRKWEQSIWQTFWKSFTADHKGKHSWAKIKRAKFDSEEASRSFTVNICAVQCSAVHCIAVQCWAVQLAHIDFGL